MQVRRSLMLAIATNRASIQDFVMEGTDVDDEWRES